jgi:pimeloyl-ACP methyl ester carboxylesterase
MQANPGRFLYQIFFHSDEARQHLESDFERTVLVTMRASTDPPVSKIDEAFQSKMMGLHLINGSVEASSQGNGGHEKTQRSKMHSEQDLAIYADQFRRSGFLNPLRWYRNVERNWKWNANKIKGQRVLMPALMVTAANDGILTPSMTKGMDKHCTDLEIHHVQEASHWILQEQPIECARVLCTWLKNKVEPKIKGASL